MEPEYEIPTPEQARAYAEREAEEQRAHWEEYYALPLSEKLRRNWSGWLFGTNAGIVTLLVAVAAATTLLLVAQNVLSEDTLIFVGVAVLFIAARVVSD